MKRDQVKKKLEVKQVQRGDCDPRQVCGTKLKLNFVKTEVAVTKTKFPRPLYQTLSKSWFAQKIAEALRD